MKKLLEIIFIIVLSTNVVQAKMVDGKWQNNLRSMFLQNKTIIYALNIRTFNAKDLNNNEIIDENEESGNFINAINRLDELKHSGINTLHLLPITPVGKLKAFGTAGSVYAIESFSEINPQLNCPSSSLTLKEQAKKFVNECHKRNINVVIDLPSCGSYDLYVKHPEYFIKNDAGQPIIPLDWEDIRVFNVGNDENINEEVFNQHKQFVDLALFLGVDGIRADVATMRPYKFWKDLINYARNKDPEFMFLAEASNAWIDAPSKYAPFTTYDKLLDAGFDGYYGNFFNLKNWKTSDELINSVIFNLNIQKKLNKTVIGSFSTHDEISPILLKGSDFSKMIIWLNATLPLNAYYLDGFQTGDDYNYIWANKKAVKTYTDNEYYFNHKGQFDIFNFSRKPGGSDYSIYKEFVMANKFRQYYSNELSSMKFIPLKTTCPNVFAYARSGGNMSIVVIGNLDFEKSSSVSVKIKGLKPKQKCINLRITKGFYPEIKPGKLNIDLGAGDIKVFILKGKEIK